MDSRPHDEYNLIIITVEDIMYQETIYELAMGDYLVGLVDFAQLCIIALSLAVFAALLFFVMTLMKILILNPIKELTKKIESNKKHENNNVDSFLEHILKRADKKQKYIQKVLK